MEKLTVYYARKMEDDFIDSIIKEYPWLIDFVKETPELDFQTGADVKGRTWFSIYRGTSRVLRFIKKSNKGKTFRDAANSYKKHAPKYFFDNQKKITKEGFIKYLENINKDSSFDKYYKSEKSEEKKEGYFQTLIGRRYTFDTKPEEDFIIIDKETVIGFNDDSTKDYWNQEIIDEQEKLIRKLRQEYNKKLPKDIKSEYGEFDFLAMNWDGDIIIMELKQADPSNTALSPIQVRFYYEQFKKLQKEFKDLSENIMKMVKQKRELGIINIPKGKEIPKKLSGKIETCVIVGEENGLTKTMCERFRFVREKFLPKMKAYTCNNDGTLVISKKLEES